MNNTYQIKLLLSLFAIQLPTLLVCFVAGIVILGRWKQGSKGSMWALLAFGLTAVLCFAIPVTQTAVQNWVRHSGYTMSESTSVMAGISIVWSGTARRHLRFALDGGIRRTLDPACSIPASLILMKTSVQPNQSMRLTSRSANNFSVLRQRPAVAYLFLVKPAHPTASGVTRTSEAADRPVRKQKETLDNTVRQPRNVMMISVPEILEVCRHTEIASTHELNDGL